MSCHYPDDFEIAHNVTYSAFNDSLTEGVKCLDTYLRPKSANTLMPWLYALFLLLFHLPACIIRAVRWESAQYLALTLAVLGIALTLQAFQSTELRAEEILVWMPLTLVLDVGAMMQMVVLILEKHGFWCLWWALRDALQAAFKATVVVITTCLPAKHPHEESNDSPGISKSSVSSVVAVAEPQIELQRQRNEGSQLLVQSSVNSEEPTTSTSAQVQRDEPDIESQQSPPRQKHPDESYEEDALRHSIVALIAFVFLLILIVLQVYGLYAAIRIRNQKDLKVQWCSPSFRDFGIALTMGNCRLYPIIDDRESGISCIELPAEQQREWIIGTIISLVAALACQIGDMILLKWTQHNSKRKCRGTVRLQRPWLTMFGGVTMLIILIVFGVFSANHLPSGATDLVWVYRKEPEKAVGRVCQAELKTPGLRGTIIAYTDGLFGNWGGTYFGKFTNE